MGLLPRARGDTESDIPMLELVEIPIAFNPNKKLFEHAKARGWRTVVERKDVIYEL
jgi:phosphoserine phosphatase